MIPIDSNLLSLSLNLILDYSKEYPWATSWTAGSEILLYSKIIIIFCDLQILMISTEYSYLES